MDADTHPDQKDPEFALKTILGSYLDPDGIKVG